MMRYTSMTLNQVSITLGNPQFRARGAGDRTRLKVQRCIITCGLAAAGVLIPRRPIEDPESHARGEAFDDGESGRLHLLRP